MKRVTLAVVLVLSFVCAKAYGQTPPACPAITVTGPAGITEPGDEGVFTGELSGEIPADVKYRWTINDGEILRGQGTLRLTVKMPDKLESNVTATLEVLGLPTGCTNEASATNPVIVCGLSILVDEFTSIPRRDQMARLDNAVTELGTRTSSKLLIIEYFPERTTQTAIDRRKKWLAAQLSRRHKLEPSAFEIITSDTVDGDPRTKIYIIPPGASNPAP